MHLRIAFQACILGLHFRLASEDCVSENIFSSSCFSEPSDKAPLLTSESRRTYDSTSRNRSYNNMNNRGYNSLSETDVAIRGYNSHNKRLSHRGYEAVNRMLSSNPGSINDSRVNQSISDSDISIDLRHRFDNCCSDFWKKTSAIFNRYVLFLIAAFRYVLA